MRFSPLHFLLLGAALAAPVHDVQRASKRTEEEGLIARGLVPLDSRAPVIAPIRAPPKPPVKPPIRPPPGKPPGGGGKPPVRPPGGGGDPPGGGGGKPPGGAACGRKRKLCVDDDMTKDLTDAEVQSFKDEGLKAQKGLDDAISGAVKVNPKATKNPKDPEGAQAYKEYVFRDEKITSKDSLDAYKKPYLNDPKWKDAFDPANSKEHTFENSPEKKKLADDWAQKNLKPQLEKDHPVPPDEPWMQDMIDMTVSGVKDQTAMLRTLNSAGNGNGGSMVVKGTYKDRDLSQPGKIRYGDPPKDYDRPGFPEGRQDLQNDPDVLFPSDQMMASWRQTVANTPDAKVTDLKWLAMDRMETPVTRKLVDDIMKKQNKKIGETMTFDKDSEIPAEREAFDQLAGTPHGAVVLRMLRDNSKDLGGKKIKAFHVLKQKDGEPPDMMIEFTMP